MNQEIELKLVALGASPVQLAAQLARMPALRAKTPTRSRLYNQYFDTPEQALRAQRTSLRLRRVGTGAKATWLQTLKTGGDAAHSALARRGEWEERVPTGELQRDLLDATPWATLDPDGTLFAQLAPCFETHFERTTWRVPVRRLGTVEVALDVGNITAGAATLALCEIELELKSGTSAAVFALAEEIAARIAVLPMAQSKSERGYALARGPALAAQPARAPALHAGMTAPHIVHALLSEALHHFVSALALLHADDGAEAVHQARLGWRRLRSLHKVFAPLLRDEALPSPPALQPLREALGRQRDLDVAALHTLPQWAEAFAAGDAQRQDHWAQLLRHLAQARQRARHLTLSELAKPAAGLALLQLVRSIEALRDDTDSTGPAARLRQDMADWSRHRIKGLHRRFERALAQARDEPGRHRARLLAKQVRYAAEALETVLPQRRARRWARQAHEVQDRIGAQRDLVVAARTAAQLLPDSASAEFLRGAASASNRCL